MIHDIYLVQRPGYFNILLIFNAIKYVKMCGHKKIQLIILGFNLKYDFSAVKVKQELRQAGHYTPVASNKM